VQKLTTCSTSRTKMFSQNSRFLATWINNDTNIDLHFFLLDMIYSCCPCHIGVKVQRVLKITCKVAFQWVGIWFQIEVIMSLRCKIRETNKGRSSSAWVLLAKVGSGDEPSELCSWRSMEHVKEFIGDPEKQKQVDLTLKRRQSKTRQYKNASFPSLFLSRGTKLYPIPYVSLPHPRYYNDSKQLHTSTLYVTMIKSKTKALVTNKVTLIYSSSLV
jgi:hypothetical protein